MADRFGIRRHKLFKKSSFIQTVSPSRDPVLDPVPDLINEEDSLKTGNGRIVFRYGHKSLIIKIQRIRQNAVLSRTSIIVPFVIRSKKELF
jgi:hypothetical protein